MTTHGDPWSDERLAAAFRANALAHPARPALVTVTLERIRRSRRPRRAWLTLVPLTAALGVAVTVGAGLLLTGGRSTSPAPSALPTPPAVVATPSATVGPDRPSRVEGLPVVRLDEAAAIRDAGIDDHAVAVHAWYREGIVPCPTSPSLESPLQLRCPDTERWLLGSPDVDTGPGADPSDQVALHPLLDPGQTFQIPRPPAELVVIGHFDDRRATLCPPAEAQACRDRFVVDRVVLADGVELPVSFVPPPNVTPERTVEDIRAAIDKESPGAVILAVTGHRGTLGAVEPSLAGRSDDRVTLDRARTPPLVWRAQVLEDGRVTTYLVGDDDLDVYEMTDENEAVLVSEGSVPPASFDPWPPVDAFGVIELTSLVGEGRPPVEVAVIDRSGHLLALREPTTADPVVRALGRSPFVLAEPGDARSIRLGWAGGVCDSRVTVTVDSLDSILIDGGPQPPCDSMGIGREVILTFDQTLDPSLIDLGYKETRTPEETPIPESSLPPGGPLEPSGGSAIPAPISVAEALEIRAQPDDDRRIAVRGWLWRDPTIYDCYVPPSPPPLLESGCRGPHDRLLADATQPDGPGFTLAFPPWVEGIGAPFGEPVEVVAVGRFDHPLADECTPSARDACAEVFVVEAVMRFGRRSSSRIHVAG